MHRTPSTLEQLESRQLLSASASAEIVDGSLQITGSDRRDVIQISLNHDDPTLLDVRVNAERAQFSLDDVSDIHIDGLGGNDRIEISEKNGPIFLNAIVSGGDGNDTIITGSGDDIIDGGAGNDSITGGAGDDYLTGDGGNDKLIGADGSDMLDAGDGKDKLQGGDGDDNLDGGIGKDSIQAGAGDNRIATDDTNVHEVKINRNGSDHGYLVTSLDDIPSQLVDVAESAVPGAVVTRVEQADENYAIYYRFGTDPIVYKAVVQILDTGDVELVGRGLSLQEARPSAMNAFMSDEPDATVLSIFQKTKGKFDVRFRDANGETQTVETSTIDWGLDDADEDADNDGRYDPHNGPDDNGNDNQGDQGQQQNGDQGQQQQQNGNQVLPPVDDQGSQSNLPPVGP